MRIVVPKEKYRVVAYAQTVWRGNDLTAALDAFIEVLPSGKSTLRDGIHTVTGGPLVEALDSNGRLAVVLYGATLRDVHAEKKRTD